jgi:hypothetical protein
MEPVIRSPNLAYRPRGLMLSIVHQGFADDAISCSLDNRKCNQADRRPKAAGPLPLEDTPLQSPSVS